MNREGGHCRLYSVYCRFWKKEDFFVFLSVPGIFGFTIFYLRFSIGLEEGEAVKRVCGF